MEYIKTFLVGNNKTNFLSIELFVESDYMDYIVGIDIHNGVSQIFDEIDKLTNISDSEKYRLIRIWMESIRAINGVIRNCISKERFNSEEEAWTEIENCYIPYFHDIFEDARKKMSCFELMALSA